MSTSRTMQVTLSEPTVTPHVTAQIWTAGAPGAAAIILAHGAGTDMTHPHLQRHATDLAVRGHPVALFNFPFTEVGRRRPDPAKRLESTWRDVITAIGPEVAPDGRPLVIGGRSMGGRIASMVAATGTVPVSGVACIAYPLHPPGRPDKLRVGHWPGLRVPILLVSGDRDAMAPIGALEEQLSTHMPRGLATVHVVRGADHSLRVRRADGRTEDEVLVEVATAVSDWTRDLQ